MQSLAALVDGCDAAACSSESLSTGDIHSCSSSRCEGARAVGE